MVNPQEYGLIGRHISHSFSAGYFSEKFRREGIDATYTSYDLADIGEIRSVLANPRLKGFNVTSPYKRDVIPFLDDISEEARELNAVNVVKVATDASGQRRLLGFNTDCPAFRTTLENEISPHTKALVLGTGGASSAVALALRQIGIDYKIVSRNPGDGQVGYEEVSSLLSSHYLVVNATPVGMYPDVEKAPDIDFSLIGPEHYCYDLIYNPPETLFLRKASEAGARIKNGLDMLIGQAELSWEIWQNDSF